MDSSPALQPRAVADPAKPGNRVGPTNPYEPITAEDAEQSIPQRFEQMAARYGDRPAVKTSEHELTYSELNRAANRLAHAILAQCGDAEGRVVYLVRPGARSVIAILGILKGGKTHVALSATFPYNRNAEIIASAQPSLIVSDTSNFSLATELASGRLPVLNLDALDPGLSEENLGLRVQQDAIATIGYTSGSTGVPKGVVHSHRKTMGCLRSYTDRMHYSSNDRVLMTFGLSFLAGVNTALVPLLNGACLVLPNMEETRIDGLIRWLVDEDVTVLLCNTTTFRHLVSALGDEAFPCLRVVIVGGEPMSAADVENYKQHFRPQCLLNNVLGSTEMPGISSYFMDRSSKITSAAVPVGYEYDGVRVLLWDEEGREVEDGQVGEIVIQSCHLALGYWQQPELTKAVFLPDPSGGDERLFRSGDLGMRLPDGALVHLGRADTQVKIRGYRVELAEVEMALLSLDNVKEAVVLARPNAHGELRLVAYVAPQHGPAPTISAVRQGLADRLPDYMIPSAVVVLDRLPVGAGGKIDRKALPEPAPTRPHLATPYVAPRNSSEASLAAIWEQELGMQPVGVHDSFFDLGGGSLSYFSMLMEAEKEFGKTLPADAFRHTPTIELLAQMLMGSGGEQAASPYSRAAHPFTRSRAGAVSWLVSPRKLLGAARRMGRRIFIKIGPRWGRFVLPYATGARFIAWLSGQGWAQATLFRAQVHLVQQCMALVGTSAADRSRVVRLSLACNFWRRWRNTALSRCRPEEFRRWVTVEGLDALQGASEQGRGVVLVSSHYSQMGVLRSVMRHTELPRTAWVRGLYERAFERADGPLTALYTGELYAAQQVLRRGGIVGVAGDGKEGSGPGQVIPFFGHKLALKTGFAELAVAADAPVVLVRIGMDVAGHVKVVFMPPLVASGQVRKQKVESLVSQYGEVLQEEWATNPAGIAWNRLADTLRVLSVGDAPSAAQAP